MITNIKVNGHEVHIRYELDNHEIQALKELKEKRYLEYRYDMSADSFDMEGYYEGRNTNISIHSLSDLAKNGFVEEDLDAWHTTYVLTELGKKTVE